MVEGYPDESLHPNWLVTRADLATMIACYLGLKTKPAAFRYAGSTLCVGLDRSDGGEVGAGWLSRRRLPTRRAGELGGGGEGHRLRVRVSVSAAAVLVTGC